MCEFLFSFSTRIVAIVCHVTYKKTKYGNYMFPIFIKYANFSFQYVYIYSRVYIFIFIKLAEYSLQQFAGDYVRVVLQDYEHTREFITSFGYRRIERFQGITQRSRELRWKRRNKLTKNQKVIRNTVSSPEKPKYNVELSQDTWRMIQMTQIYSIISIQC